MIIAKGIWKSELIDIYSMVTSEQSLTKEMSMNIYVWVSMLTSISAINRL